MAALYSVDPPAVAVMLSALSEPRYSHAIVPWNLCELVRVAKNFRGEEAVRSCVVVLSSIMNKKIEQTIDRC